eukprot:4979080-Alexandrium_andersonii.AAC.1
MRQGGQSIAHGSMRPKTTPPVARLRCGSEEPSGKHQASTNTKTNQREPRRLQPAARAKVQPRRQHNKARREPTQTR